MAPKTKKQFEEIRFEKKNLIRETALKLFALDGYYCTSVNTIAKSAGISKGLIYNYYQSKEEILEDILNSLFSEIMENLDLNHNGILQKEELRFFIERIFKLIEKNPGLWRLYYTLSMQQPVAEIVKNVFYERITTLFSMLINYFKSEGSTAPEVETMIFHSLLDGLFMNYTFSPELYSINLIKAHIFKMYNI